MQIRTTPICARDSPADAHTARYSSMAQQINDKDDTTHTEPFRAVLERTMKGGSYAKDYKG